MDKKTKNTFMEDVRYGIYDRPGPSGRVADDELEDSDFELPSEVPVLPTPQMSNQLTVDRPPIEDEEFVPGSTEELSRAASAVAQLVPNQSIDFFYKALHKLLDDATDKAQQKEEIPAEEDKAPNTKKDNTEGEEVKESVLRQAIRRALKNTLTESRYDDETDLYGNQWDEQGYSVIEPDEPVASYDTAKDQKKSDDATLEQIADEFGYAGAPGARKEINKLTDRMKYFATKVKKSDLEALMDYAAGEYTDVLADSKLVDEEDIEDLRSAPQLVRKLDSFRFFFVGSFILPAYREIVRDATKKVKQEIEQMGVPEILHQTVFNQVTGGAAVKPALIKKKLGRLVASNEISEKEASEIASKIETSRTVLTAMAEDFSDDMVQRSLDKWQSVSKKQRIAALNQALEQTE